MDKFEEIIKSSVNQYEVPYSPNAWKSLSKKMGPGKGLVTKWAIGISASIICVALLILGITYNANTTIKPLPEVTANLQGVNSNQEPSISKNETPINPVENSKEELIDNSNSKTDQIIATKPNQIKSIITEPLEVENNTKQLVEKPATVDKLFTIAKPSEFINKKDETLVELVPMDKKIINPKENINDSPLLLDASEIQICQGKPVKLHHTLSNENTTYKWNLGDGNIIETNDANYFYEFPGDYTIKLVSYDKTSNAKIISFDYKVIHVIAKPENIIQLTYSDEPIPTVKFNQLNDVSTSQIVWEIDGQTRTSAHSFNYQFKHKGNYKVTCTIINENGCSNTDVKTVNIKSNYNLLAPNVFKPDGDGNNETFIPKALLVSDQPFVMHIYDHRTGKLIFESNNSGQPWDGLRREDLTPVPAGPYVWAVNCTNSNGEQEYYQGTILLIR